jgi:hypothetical protein
VYYKTLKASKKLYFQDQLGKYQADAKKTWELLRKIINNKRRSSNSIQSIVVNGTLCYDSLTIANNFNAFFAGVASSIVQNMNPSPVNLELDPNTIEDDNSDSLKFNSNPLTCTEISDAIYQLKD